MGAYYFGSHDTAILPFVGLTQKELREGKATLSAFVEYTQYPIAFPEGGTEFVWQNGADFDLHDGSPTYMQKCGPMPSKTVTSAGNFTSIHGDPSMRLTSYVWTYERVGATPFPGGPPAAPAPPHPKWPPPAPCPMARCTGAMHGRNWGGPPSNGTANGTGIATATAAACLALCEKDPGCAAMTWKSAACVDKGVGPCGAPDDACCYLLAITGRVDNSSGWCSHTKSDSL